MRSCYGVSCEETAFLPGPRVMLQLLAPAHAALPQPNQPQLAAQPSLL